MMKEQQPLYLWQYVEKWASVKPDADAVVFKDRRISWAQLAASIDRAAAVLLDIGVEKADCVALISPPRPEFLISFMAAAKVGAIWTGISPRFTITEMDRILRDCMPAALITVSRYRQTDMLERTLGFGFEYPCIREILVIEESSSGMRSFMGPPEDIAQETEARLAERITQLNPMDEALLMYTSGSLGLPKGVLHSHATILSNVCQQHRLFEINSESKILLHFPINHVAADVEIGFCALYAGACIVVQEDFDARIALEIIERERITVVGQVPSMYLMELQDQCFAQTDWSSVKTFVWGGSAASSGMLRALKEICNKTGARMITGYGSTELGGFITATRAADGLETLATTVGVPYDNCELRIVDEQRRPLPTGEVGEVAARGPVVMKGYLNSPAKTAEVIDDAGWYYTSDLGVLNADGSLTLCGRRSEMFKTCGENVFPCEVEAVLEAHPDVVYAAVVAVPHDILDEVGHAHVMPAPGSKATPEELLEWCRKRMAHFKVPRHIYIHEALPLLPNGKVDKQALLALIRPK